ncbi:hypothetical protein Ciccas_010466 [Cichlidogyrus casuarinus]|uniref:GLE1 RNA export mediator n=1 Tax=Cichlidogyrus casuarinus TaxID=1844966 RepID=A0ABD2PUV3_9PLAT
MDPNFDRYGYLSGPEVDVDALVMKIRGVSRLLAATCLAQPPTGRLENQIYSPGLCWRLLATLANDKPWFPSVTAEAITGLLELCGGTFYRLYGNQATKLFNFIIKSIEEDEELKSEACESALCLFLKNSMEKKAWPLGFVNPKLWSLY